MRESPSSTNQEIPACAGMTEKDSFYTGSHAGIPIQYQSGDSCIHTNDSLQVGNNIR
ncbi:MAG: hypothetical protein NT007_12520 [Candidatus Kapabacteria bacterium]|nr:hypothetical protein [Candidatus Kapabacteria bacterium]